MAKIGVFDSGIGGLSVARAIESAFPEHEVIFRNDQEHVPYGSKSVDQIRAFCWPIFQSLIDAGCEVIVVACNTVSVLLASELRKDFNVPFIALDPMVKPAANGTKTGVIAVCATPRTLASERYQWLKQTYAPNIRVIEPDCSDWSYMIEHDRVDDAKVQQHVTAALREGADVIVLACTHYHWIEERIKEIVRGRAIVMQPEQAIVDRLGAVLRGEA